jgi:hypothetical protein
MLEDKFDYSLQFGEEEIIAFFEQANLLTKKSLNSFTIEKQHSVVSPRASLSNSAFELIFQDSMHLLENLLQRSYIHTINCISTKQSNYFETLLNLISSNRWDKDEGKKLITLYLETLNSLVDFLPVLENIFYINPLTDNQLDLVKQIDTYARIIIYDSNSLYSLNYKSDIHYLDRDVNRFVDQAQRIMVDDEIIVNGCNVSTLLTTYDYVNNVIAPLVWNAREHAFLAENDSLKRNKIGFQKSVEIVGSPNQDLETQQGEYLVVVLDNGFGIKEEVISQLFEIGISSKPKDETQHGIGLWAAKQYVEDRGGKMSFESSFGQGSIFKFTIPYHSLNESFIPIQER